MLPQSSYCSEANKLRVRICWFGKEEFCSDALIGLCMHVAGVGLIYIPKKNALTTSNPSLSPKHSYSFLFLLNSVESDVNTTVSILATARITVLQMSGEDMQYYGWVERLGSHVVPDHLFQK